MKICKEIISLNAYLNTRQPTDWQIMYHDFTFTDALTALDSNTVVFQ